MVQTASSSTPAAIRTLEEYGFRALPALTTRLYDGWVLRFARGYTRRANSINPLYASALPLDDKLTQCELLYQKVNLPVHFRLTSAHYPAELEKVLAGRGYVRDDAEVSIHTANLNPAQLQLSPQVQITERVTSAWLDAYTRLSEFNEQHLPTFRRMLGRIRPQVACAMIVHAGEVIAVGLAVQDGAYLGLFDIVTAATYRRQGYGRALVASLMHWGASHGAETAYLQVLANNQPALTLYDGLGFGEVYRYWYWTLKQD